MPFYPNLEAVHIEEYQALLIAKNLLPSRQALLENIEAHFFAIRKAGVSNVDSLIKALSTPQRLSTLAKQTLVPESYLVLLKREAGGLIPKAAPISSLIGINADTLAYLHEAGITSSKQYHEAYKAGEIISVPPDTAKDLFAQCDLLRISGIGPLAAKMFIEAGYDSVGKVSQADDKAMLDAISRINANGQYYTGTLGLKDMQFCIENAKFLAKYA